MLVISLAVPLSLHPHLSIHEMGFIFLTSFLGAQGVTFKDFSWIYVVDLDAYKCLAYQ